MVRGITSQLAKEKTGGSHMKRGRLSDCAAGCSSALGACGGKKQSVLYTLEQDNEGLKMTDTMTAGRQRRQCGEDGGDYRMDMAGFDDDTQTLMMEAYDSLVESYQAVDGVECTGTTTDSVYTIQSPLIPRATRCLSSLSRDCFRWMAVRTEFLWKRQESHWKQAAIQRQNKEQDDAEAPTGGKAQFVGAFSCNRKFLWNPLLHEKYYRIKFAKYILSHSVKQLKQA